MPVQLRKILLTFVTLCVCAFINHVIAQARADEFRYVRPATFGVQAGVAVMPAARVHTFEGEYRMQTRPELSFSGGGNYFLNVNDRVSFNTGLHLNVTKTYFALWLNAADRAAVGDHSGNGSLMDVKEVSYRLMVPLWANWRTAGRTPWNLSAGVNLNYGGFNSAYGIGYVVYDTNRRSHKVMDATVDGGTGGALWPSFRLSLGKILALPNGNEYELGLFGEYSGTGFLTTTYNIDVPGQPLTRGQTVVTGTCVGLAMQFRFSKPGRRVAAMEGKRKRGA